MNKKNRFILLNITAEKKDDWDKAIRNADEKFGGEEHDIVRFIN